MKTINELNSDIKFCHFTSTENARNILSTGTFYLNKFNAMNDLEEARLHEDEKDKIFCLSFCHSEALNIPLFYLYGGIDGKGCRLQFTSTKIKEILSNSTLYYVNKNNVRLRKVVDKSNYSIDFDWIYYVASAGYCEYKNKTKTEFQTLQDALEKLRFKGKHYFVKNPVWKFEKEFRIIVKFTESIHYDKIALQFNIKDNEKSISLICGPECKKEEVEIIKEEFSEYGITKVSSSTTNTISMRLCQRNKNMRG